MSPDAIYIEPANSADFIKIAARQNKELQEARQYLQDHVFLVVQEPGRSGKDEAILRAGEKKDLKIWVCNEGQDEITGRISLAPETSEGVWYGSQIEMPGPWRGERKKFNVKPGEQSPIVFSLKAKDKARTFNATIRTKTYINVGRQEVFLDPTKIEIIVLAKPDICGTGGVSQAKPGAAPGDAPTE